MPLPDEPSESLLSSETKNSSNPLVEANASISQQGSKRPLVGGMLAPLKVRNFRLLFGGQTISTLGDAFYAVALPWLILNGGGNPQELGIVLTGYSLPRVGSIMLGGILSDRLRPRRVMLLADAVRAVLVGVLALLGIVGHPALWQLLLIAIPLGAFEGIFLPASFSMIPEVLKDKDLQAGNALNSASTQLSTFVGSGIGGLVVGVLGSGAALAVYALSFLVSALSLAAMRGKPSSLASESITPQNLVPEGMVTVAEPVDIPDVVAGESSSTVPTDASKEASNGDSAITFWNFLRTSQLLRAALAVSVVGNLAIGGLIDVALPALAHGPLAAGASGYGLILAAFGAGALVGGLGIGAFGNIPRQGIFAMLVALVQAATFAIIPFAGGLIGATITMVVCGVCNSITNVIFMTVMQQRLPRHLLGRIMGVLMLATFGAFPLSVAVAGIVVNRFGPAILFPVSGAALFAAILFGLSQRELREV